MKILMYGFADILGKYRLAFQRYIRGASGYDAHIETALGRVDHSTADVLHAMERMKGLGRIFAYLIAGHHAGLLPVPD